MRGRASPPIRAKQTYSGPPRWAMRRAGEPVLRAGSCRVYDGCAFAWVRGFARTQPLEGKRMNRIPRPARIAFALGMLGLGILLVVYGDFALGWPAWVPWRGPLVHVAAACLLLGGAGLLF